MHGPFCSSRFPCLIVDGLYFTYIWNTLQVMMNSMNVPSKRSTLERKLDKLILALFATLFGICFIGAIGRCVILTLCELLVEDITVIININIILISIIVIYEVSWVCVNCSGFFVNNKYFYLRLDVGGEGSGQFNPSNRFLVPNTCSLKMNISLL